MKIKIISIGKIKEKFAQKWIDEFSKRINKWTKIEIIEIKECGKKEESKKIEARLNADDYNILLDREGELISSEKLSEIIKDKLIIKNITFILGGPNGVDKITGIHKSISMSKMTFTHQMARVFLFEQIYRGLSIVRGIKYHK